MKLRVVFFAACAAVACAQGPGGGTPPEPSLTGITSYLGLSTTQVESLQSIQTQERTALQPLLQQIGQAQTAVQNLIGSGSTDTTALAAALLNVQNLRKQVTQKQGSFQAQAVAVLTADQKTKLGNLQAAQKLEPAIHEAEFLNLLAPPENAAGPGVRPAGGPGGGGPRGFGRRMPPVN